MTGRSGSSSEHQKYTSIEEQEELYQDSIARKRKLDDKDLIRDFDEHNRYITDCLNTCRMEIRPYTILVLCLIFVFFFGLTVYYQVESGYGRYFEKYHYLTACILITLGSWFLNDIMYLLADYIYFRLFHIPNYDEYNLKIARRIWVLRRITFWYTVCLAVVMWSTLISCWINDDTGDRIQKTKHESPNELDWYHRYFVYTQSNLICYYITFIETIFVAIYSFSYLSTSKIIVPLALDIQKESETEEIS